MNGGLELENARLREQLDALMAQARANEGRLHRFQEMQFRILRVASLPALLESLVEDTRRSFDLSHVTLLLADREGEIARHLDRLRFDPATLPGLRLTEDALTPFERGGEPVLGPCEKRHAALFAAVPLPASAAVIPVLRGADRLGTLVFGSADGTRFQPHFATEFLAQFGAVAAVCLENALNHERLRLAGVTDSLTGAYNRRYFEHRLTEEVARAAREQTPLACLLLDVDHFKRINDAFGHPAGDAVLAEFAARLRAHVRGHDLLARYGGEEFAMLLPGMSAEDARSVAERARREVCGRPFEIAEGTVEVTVSIGIGLLPAARRAAGPVAGKTLVADADAALYEAKRTGRNRVSGPATPAKPEPVLLRRRVTPP